MTNKTEQCHEELVNKDLELEKDGPISDETYLPQDEAERTTLQKSVRVVANVAGLPTTSALKLTIERRREKRRNKQASGELIETEEIVNERYQRERLELLMAIVTDVLSALLLALPLVLEIINSKTGQNNQELLIVMMVAAAFARYVWGPMGMLFAHAFGDAVALKIQEAKANRTD